MSSTLLISTAEAAALAGVGVSSIKRWADAGVLACHKTAGGHRRFERSVLERFLREIASHPHCDATGLFSHWIEPMQRGDRHALQARLFEARERLGGWCHVADEVGAVLSEIGQRWAAGLLTIAEEHAATESLIRALVRVGDSFPERTDGRRCLLACAPNDQHTLGLVLIELCLREVGWIPCWLGSNMLACDIVQLVQQGNSFLPSVHMVALSAAAASVDTSALTAFAAPIAAVCRGAGIPVVLGGGGAWPDPLSGCVRMTSCRQFHDYLLMLGDRP